MKTKSSFAEEESAQTHRGQSRRVLYWALAVVANLVFAYLTFVMMMVPGILPAEKILNLSIAGGLLIIALIVVFWPSTSDAPAVRSQLSTIAAVILLLEFVWCIVGIGTLATGH